MFCGSLNCLVPSCSVDPESGCNLLVTDVVSNSSFAPWSARVMQEERGSSPLHEAVLSGELNDAMPSEEHVESVERLLLARANPNALDAKGYTPLHLAAQSWACWSDDFHGPRIPQLLVSYGAGINALTPSGDTPLHLAVRTRQRDGAIQFFLEAGSDLNARNAEGYTPLQLHIKTHLMSYQSIFYESGVQLLIRGGADVNLLTPNKETLLHWVIQDAGSERVVLFLLRAGALLNCLDAQGGTPLHRLVTSHFVLNWSDCAITQSQILRRIDLLLNAGALIDFSNRAGNTALHLAIRVQASWQVIERLLKRGADPNAKNHNGDTALDLAEKFKEPNVYREKVTQLLRSFLKTRLG